MSEAQDAATAYACAALEQVHAAAALVAVGRQLRVPEDPEFRHGDESGNSIRRHVARHRTSSRRRHHTHGRAEVRV